MNLNEEEIAIINRAFEQLPFANPFGNIPPAEPLDSEAARYNQRASETVFPELFDKDGEANNFVDGKQAEEVLRICSFFEHCRKVYKKETLEDKRKQIKIFSEALPYLYKENKKIATNRVKNFEKELPENILAGNISAFEAVVERLNNPEKYPFCSLADIEEAKVAFGAQVPEHIQNLYDTTVTNSLLQQIEKISQRSNIIYMHQFEVDSIVKFGPKVSENNRLLIRKNFALAVIGQFEKGFKDLSARNEDLKSKKSDVKYQKHKKELETDAYNYVKMFCKYVKFMTSHLQTSLKMETLCNYALKIAGIAEPAYRARCFELKAEICRYQEEAYKEIPNNELAELLAKRCGYDRQKYRIDADLARSSRAEYHVQIQTRVSQGERYRDIEDERRRVDEQISIYRRRQYREGYIND